MIRLKENTLPIVGTVALIAAGFLFMSTMDDGPGPPRKRAMMPTGFHAGMLTDASSPDAILFIRICTQCHDLPDPKLHTAEEWPMVVSQMADRARRARFFSGKRFIAPSKESVNQISAYLSQQAQHKP